MTTDGELLQRQQGLQAEADAAVADLGLDAALKVFGTPVRTGSSALGLMVKPDVDLTVACPALDADVREAVLALGTRLARHERVWQISFRDDTGAWNREPEDYPDGLYLQVRYRSATDRDWNFDIWFVDQPERQPDLAHLRTLLPRLTDASRVVILRIKEEWVTRAEYGRSVNGAKIYEAVLDGGVRTPEEFGEWVRVRARAAGADGG